MVCPAEPHADDDGDGFTAADGDCNDCLAAINPGAYDFPDDQVDDDCSGSAAREDERCDRGLPLTTLDPTDAARALGLCRFLAPGQRGWGVLEARFTDAHGTGALSDPRAIGVLPDFGAMKPREGSALFALSSGVARAPGQPGYTSGCDELDAVCPSGTTSHCTGGAAPPPGYPKQDASCGPSAASAPPLAFNQAALELQLRVPNNVSTLSFDSAFYTFEQPSKGCHGFNDGFVVLKEPRPSGSAEANIVLDARGEPLGVGTALFALCDRAAYEPGTLDPRACMEGTSQLRGSGYGPRETTCPDAHGASTGWLHTTAPVTPGEVIKLRFAIWDTNDVTLDSTALVDAVRWSKLETALETVPLI